MIDLAEKIGESSISDFESEGNTALELQLRPGVSIKSGFIAE
jgi:hypothetical protein